jgi:hypothetical protein
MKLNPVKWFSPDRPDEHEVAEEIKNVDQKMTDVEQRLEMLKARVEVITHR